LRAPYCVLAASRAEHATRNPQQGKGNAACSGGVEGALEVRDQVGLVLDTDGEPDQ
jgi:hypothetical protein